MIFQFKISFSNFIRLAEGHCSWWIKISFSDSQNLSFTEESKLCIFTFPFVLAEEGANCSIYDGYKLDVYIQICSPYLLPLPCVLFMTWKSSSEQSFKLTGIALMIVKVSRGMGEERYGPYYLLLIGSGDNRECRGDNYQL